MGIESFASTIKKGLNTCDELISNIIDGPIIEQGQYFNRQDHYKSLVEQMPKAKVYISTGIGEYAPPCTSSYADSGLEAWSTLTKFFKDKLYSEMKNKKTFEEIPFDVVVREKNGRKKLTFRTKMELRYPFQSGYLLADCCVIVTEKPA